MLHIMLLFQEKLAEEYNYKSLPKDLSNKVKRKYLADLENTCIGKYLENKDCALPLYTLEGTPIAKDFSKIVIGDYGAFIEIDEENILEHNIKVNKGQEFRYEDKYRSCKYYWLTDVMNSGIKIYHQKNTVPYANYVPGKYYASPYEVKINYKNIAVVGSRDFTDYLSIECMVGQYIYEECWNLPEGITIVSGGAKGADTLAEKFADEYKCRKIIFLPDWESHGKSAGPIRNRSIIANADVIFAFQKNKSKGTQHSINIAKELGKELYVFEV